MYAVTLVSSSAYGKFATDFAYKFCNVMSRNQFYSRYKYDISILLVHSEFLHDIFHHKVIESLSLNSFETW